MKRLLACALLSVLPCAATATELPETGQTSCYDEESEISCPAPGQDFYGQDAQYTCNTRSFTDLGNGIVRDNVTGLEWQKDSPSDTYRWQEALDYCSTLGLGGYDDWRLPSIKELATLVDTSIPDPGPTVNIDYFPDTVGSIYSDYWTSTAEAEIPNNAWVVHFSDGSVKGINRINAVHIRAVRGEPYLLSNTFTDNEDGTITDTSTDLMWEVKTDDGGPRDKDNVYTWEQALSYCENLNLADHDDWRLPNRNELQSIIDYNRFGPSLDPLFSSPRPSANWSSNTNADIPSNAWIVNFYNGDVNTIGKGQGSYVYAVRGGQCRVTTTTTTAPQTTTIPDDRCPAKRLYGEHSAATALLRCFRDSVLSRTAEGQEIIKLYYQWSPVIAQAMEEDAGLGEWIQETIDSVLPIIEREVAQQCVQNNLRH